MENFYTHKIIINKAQSKERLDKALTKIMNKYTRSQIKIFIQNNNVFHDDKIINDASLKVNEGQVFKINIPVIKETKHKPEKIPINIVYQDKDLMIIDKHAGIVTHPAPGNQSGTLVNAILNQNENLSTINNLSRPGIVHRLDKDTSGLLVVAKTDEAHLKLSEQFKNHSIARKYYAIVWGTPTKTIIEGYIKRSKINRKKMSLNKNDGKFSKTIINLKKNYGICSLIECELKTGRTHQVRLHLTSINSPIVGDKLYGKNKMNKFAKDKNYFNQFMILKNFKRQALHAYHLGFIHPKTNKYIKFESELPEDIKNLQDFLLKY